MRLLFDLDGTIAHFDLRFDEVLEELYPHLTGIPRSKDQKQFNLWEGRTPEEQDAIRTIMNHEGFYRDLKPMPGGIEAVKEAHALGHEVHFVSAPWTSNLTCAQDKFDWIGKHFGDDWRDKLVLAKDKTIVSGDVLFDDKEPIPHKERADWTQVYIDQPYNQGVPGYRIFEWDQWKDVVALIENERIARRVDTITIPIEKLQDFKFVTFGSAV